MRRALALASLALAACTGPMAYTDDLDLTLDFTPFSPDFDDDLLHTPYVKGAQVTVFARPRPGVEAGNLEVASADDDVFEVIGVELGDDGTLVIDGVAMGTGATELVVTRRGEEFDAVPIDVGFPTRAELHAAGPMFVDLDDAESTPQILSGGLATFQVRYFAGDERLYGNGVLGALNLQGVDLAQAEQTYLFESREWLQVSSGTLGPVSVDLEVDGQLLGTAPFEIVEPSTVAGVQIFGTNERGARNGDWQVLVAQAEDIEGERIYGVDFAWEIDGVLQSGQGDLYRYEFQRNGGSDVRAAFADQEAFATANIGEGYVDSSNNLGCDASAVGAGSLAWVVGLFAARRRTTVPARA